jgi:hypothetical protein
MVRRSLVLLALCVLPSLTQAEDALAAYVSATAATLDTRIQHALARIDGVPRQLLALRSYVRVGDRAAERWSWTQAEIVAYYRSAEYQQLLRELEAVQQHFAARNPGFALHVNTDVRSLDVQIERWNENPTVARAAKELERDARRELKQSGYDARPDAASLRAFKEFLRTWFPSSPPSLAAPGLSRHGQARAFDFHVQKGKTIVASTQMSHVKPVWDAQGWTEKVSEAVHAASTRFEGPLEQPREPWHYEYVPEAD